MKLSGNFWLNMSKMISVLKNTVLFLIIFTITLLALDLFIRYAGISQLLIYRYDSLDGRVFIENAEYTMTTEGFAMGTINDQGYIGPGYGEERTPGKLRIALLGDSYVEGFQHFDRNHFRAVMGRELSKKYGIDAEVMNFGKFGYNLLDMYSNHKNFVSRFDPDITLFFISSEDIGDTTTQSLMPNPFLIGDSLGIIYYNEPPRKRPWIPDRNALSMISPTVMMIRNCMTLIGKGETSGILFGKFSVLFNGSAPEQNDNRNDIKPLSPIGKKILQELAQKKGNIVVYREKKSLPDSEINAITGTGIKFISLNSLLGNRQDIFFTDKNGNEGHWNIHGHELIGKYLASEINAMTSK